MKNISLLDCTLRDGGYINDWNFGHNTLISIFERLVSANLEYIEVGFLDEKRPFDINRSIFPNTESANKIYGRLDKGKSKVVAMIDIGTCDSKNLQYRNKTCIDGIRLIFRKHFMREAMEYIKEYKKLGYDVFANAVATTNYNKEELIQLINLLNEANPYCVSIVDTYGLFKKEGLSEVFDFFDKHLDPNMALAYHSHNNFQLGYANCIELAQRYEGNREIIFDGCVYGMGNNAGNAPTELIAMMLNDEYEKNYDISQILELIDSNIIGIWKKTPWGYGLKFFIAAANGVTCKYVNFLLDKQTLSVKSINEILQKLPKDEKQFFNASLIEQLYMDYQQQDCEDSGYYAELRTKFADKQILVLGPGTSIKNEESRIKNYIDKNSNLTVIAINYMPEFCKSDYIFLTNSKRYIRLSSILSDMQNDVKIIATSNITKFSGKFDFVLDYEKLINRNGVFIDNSLMMLLKAMMKIGIKEVALAGFDGYSIYKEHNYYQTEMEYETVKQKYEALNTEMNNFLAEIKLSLSVKFITETEYRV